MTAFLEHATREQFGLLKLPRLRTRLQFAEEELVLASGPRRGLRFRADYMPWTRLVLEEYDRHRYRRFFLSGPAQGAKTTIGFILPAMYALFECEQDVILGAPLVEMAQSAYEERLKPSIEAGRYAKFLPTAGGGSRGGRSLSVGFLNGARLRFMGAGGGDAQRSSYTAQVIIMTEIDKMDDVGRASEEADPVTQMETRSAAFGDAAEIYAECTMSTEHGRIYREVCEYGTDSSLRVPCPHCRKWVALDREHFQGWRDAPDVLAARARACYTCPSCSVAWTEGDRRVALREPLIVSKGQDVGDAGELTGEPPPTNTFGFRWTALASSLVTMADIAEREHRAERSEEPADLKAAMQFLWARPWSESVVDISGLSVKGIADRMAEHPKGLVPPGTAKVTLAIDLGLYQCYWAAVAWSDEARGHVFDYGAIDVPQERQADPLRILSGLRAFRDDVIKHGWGGGGRQPDLVLVDSGWKPEITYGFVAESGHPYYAAKGRGSGKNQDRWHAPKSADERRKIGNGWLVSLLDNGIKLVEFHSDSWKAAVHDGFSAGLGAPGALTLYKTSMREHYGFARQITAEKREQEFVAGTGERTYWNRISRDNHWLDAMAMARAAADMVGVKMMRPAPSPPAKGAPVAPAPATSRPIRTRYG